MAAKNSLLLVDDEPELIELLSFFLKDRYNVTLTSDPLEAKTILEESNFAYDIMITDLKMPGMGGDELARAMRANNGNCILVVMSGHTMDDKDASTLEGIDNVIFMMKPFAANELIDKIEQHLSVKLAA